MIIRNDASYLIFFAWLAVPIAIGRPMTGDRSSLQARVYHLLSRFYLFTGTIADIHKIFFVFFRIDSN